MVSTCLTSKEGCTLAIRPSVAKQAMSLGDKPSLSTFSALI